MSILNVPLTYGSPEYALPRSRSVANVKDILPAPAPTSYQHGPVSFTSTLPYPCGVHSSVDVRVQLTRSYSVPDLVGADVRRVRNPYKPQWSSYYITNYPYRYYPEYSLVSLRQQHFVRQCINSVVKLYHCISRKGFWFEE